MDTIHTYPVEDIEDHDTESGGACHCRPRCEEYEGSLLVVHNSFDGRELKEKIILGRN